jgi:hypothetical protein
VVAKYRAWWAANRERVNQHRRVYQRDYRARVKASRAERTRGI